MRFKAGKNLRNLRNLRIKILLPCCYFAALLLVGCAGGVRSHCPDGEGRRSRAESRDWVRARILRIVDGDTIEVDFNGDGVISSFGERVRLARIDCPERTDPRNMAAREWLEEHALGKWVRVKKIGRDRWSRWLCEVELDGENLSDRLHEAGWATLK